MRRLAAILTILLLCLPVQAAWLSKAVTVDKEGILRVTPAFFADNGIVTEIVGTSGVSVVRVGSTVTISFEIDPESDINVTWDAITGKPAWMADDGSLTLPSLVVSGKMSGGTGTASGTGSAAFGGGTAAGYYAFADSAGVANANWSHADSAGLASGQYAHADSMGRADSQGSHAHANGTVDPGADYARAYGQGALTKHAHSSVSSDGTAVESTAENQHTVYASGGIRLLGSPTEGVDPTGDAHFMPRGYGDGRYLMPGYTTDEAVTYGITGTADGGTVGVTMKGGASYTPATYWEHDGTVVAKTYAQFGQLYHLVGNQVYCFDSDGADLSSYAVMRKQDLDGLSFLLPAPSDDKQYVQENGAWVEVTIPEASGGGVVVLADTGSFMVPATISRDRTADGTWVIKFDPSAGVEGTYPVTLDNVPSGMTTFTLQLWMTPDTATGTVVTECGQSGLQTDTLTSVTEATYVEYSWEQPVNAWGSTTLSFVMHDTGTAGNEVWTKLQLVVE